MGAPPVSLNRDRDAAEDRELAREIREGLDDLLDDHHDLLTDRMRDRMLTSAARKLGGRP
jgi:hypothetical protein